MRLSAAVAIVLCSLSTAAFAGFPASGEEPVTIRYVLVHMGEEKGFEEAVWTRWEGGWILRSRGSIHLGQSLPFQQETRYRSDGTPIAYEFQAVVGADTQKVTCRLEGDSLAMSVRVQGRWHHRTVAAPEQTTILDNFLTSQVQTFLWGIREGEDRVAHAGIPQKLTFLPAVVNWKGTFEAEPAAEDRGQPVPVPVPASHARMQLGPVAVELVVAKDGGWLLEAAIPSQGARFETREISVGQRVVYRYEPPAPGDQEGFREVPVPFQSEGLDFEGTFCVPEGEGPFPAVLLLPGSGPMDRNETVGPNAPLRDIAHGLGRRGIASFRFDKRTYRHPTSLDLSSLTLDEEILRDAQMAFSVMAGQPEVDAEALFVLGHSLGGTAALLLDPEEKVRGIVLLATMGRPFTEVLRDQLEYLLELGRREGRLSPEEEQRTHEVLAALDSLEQGLLPSDRILLGMTPHYITDLDRRDVFGGIGRRGTPVLILQGGKDYQVTEEDARALEKGLRAAGVEDVTLQIFPELGHLFIPVEGTPSPSSYQVPGRVDEAVLDAISGWIRDHL
jgi:hypothetical protein